jgi:hypothetical protein
MKSKNQHPQPYAVEELVSWKWYQSKIHGKVIEVFFGPIEKNLKGSLIKRIGSLENPAYLVQSIKGNFALKLHSELEKFDI